MREYSYIKKALLRNLSEDARISVTELSKRLKCSRNTVVNNIQSLEEEFGINYTLEFRKHVLGIGKHIWRIKFGKKPKNIREIRELFKDDKRASMIALTEGDFDMLIDVPAETGENYVKWGLDTIYKLLPYRPILKSSQAALRHTGYMKLTSDFLKVLDFSKLGIDDFDKQILLLLNDNSRLSYTEIAEKLGGHEEMIRYRMKKILANPSIARCTIALEKVPTKYNIAFFINFRLAPGIFQRSRKAYEHYLKVNGSMPLINPFPYLSFVSGSYLFYGIGCFDSKEQAFKEVVLAHREIYKEDKPAISYAQITEVIKGILPIRNIDFAKNYVPIPREI